MKTISLFKTRLLQATFISATLLGAAACQNSQKAEDTKEVAEEHNEAKFDDSKSEKDAQFLVNAAEINLKEIALGELAQSKSMMTDVKDLGKMMKSAHLKSFDDLTALAKKKSITIPTSPTDEAKDDYKKLNDKSGSDFDIKYCDLMVKGHKDAIEAFEKASTDAKDADIRDWATNTLPELRAHLDHAISCQKKCEKYK